MTTKQETTKTPLVRTVRSRQAVTDVKVTAFKGGDLLGGKHVAAKSAKVHRLGRYQKASTLVIAVNPDWLRVAEPLRVAFAQLTKADQTAILSMDPLEGCLQLMSEAARIRGAERMHRSLVIQATRMAAESAAGGFVGPSELARQLNRSRQTIRDWTIANRLLAVDDNGRPLYPMIQFDEHGQALPGLDKFLETLAKAGIKNWMALDVLIGESPKFGVSPAQLLRAGRTDDAMECEEAYCEAGAA